MNLPTLEKKCISIGYSDIDLVDDEEIEEIQIGYSVHSDGRSLVGKKDGDWMKDWIVIGRETLSADPIFIDTGNHDFPVYTATHGQGSWEPDSVSSTYAGFLKILRKLEQLAIGRDSPVALEEKPMTQEEYDGFIAFASDAGELEDTYFWASLISDEEAGIGPEI